MLLKAIFARLLRISRKYESDRIILAMDMSGYAANENYEEYTDNKIEDCLMCNGFYSLNFNQPLCSTCHLFLFPASSNEGVQTMEKADSCDSGNEEPNAEVDVMFDSLDSKSLMNSAIVLSNDRLEVRVKELSIPKFFSFRSPPAGLVDSLPTEVLLCVFSYLNDIALYNAQNVCQRWRGILDSILPDEKWREFIGQRWPLFKPVQTVLCWKNLYSRLIESVSCLYCMGNESIAHLSQNSWRYTRLRHELKNFCADPLDGIRAQPMDPFYFNWQASIAGPQGSPYEGGLFFLRLQVPPSYPMDPPSVHFVTKIFHPNISRHGDIGLDSINHNWSLALTIAKVLISIQSLLTDPYSYVCMEPKIGRLYQYNRKLFEMIAQRWTSKYAIHEI